VRLAAAIALKRMGAAAVPALKVALNDPDMGVRARVAFALGNIEASAITGVTEALQTSDRQIRQTAALTLDDLTSDSLRVQRLQNQPGGRPIGNQPGINRPGVPGINRPGVPGINRPGRNPWPQGNQMRPIRS
jgi:hypothetical protein